MEHIFKRKVVHFNVNDMARLHCDECGYDLSQQNLRWGAHMIGYACPACKLNSKYSNMLTVKDYLAAERLIVVLNFINKWFSWVPWLGSYPDDPCLNRVQLKGRDGEFTVRYGDEKEV